MNSSHQQNIRLVVFDFDGTIADTSEGIIDAHRYTLDHLKLPIPSDKKLKSFIGGNLLNIYIENFDINDSEAREATRVYRDRYSENGIHMAKLYPNFKQMLIDLRSMGYMLGVATLKADVFANLMLKELGIDKYFNCICGIDDNDSRSKADLILRCCEICNCTNEQTVLVGDSINDYNGAIAANVEFIGVTYGFGFANDCNYDFIQVRDPSEIVALFS